MHISVIYALPHEQFFEELDVAEGTTAEEAVHMSDLPKKHPDIDLLINKLGIFAKLVKGNQVLGDGDRVEIYRSLPVKPRNAHAADDKKARIRAKREKRAATSQ